MKFKIELKEEFLKGRKIYYVADEIGISLQHLSNILNGKKKCKKLTAKAISNYNNKDIEYYFIIL